MHWRANCNKLYRGTDYNIIHLLLGSYSTFKTFTHMWHNSRYMIFQCKMCFLSKTFTTFVKSKFWGWGGWWADTGYEIWWLWYLFCFGEFSPLDDKKKPSSTHTKGIFVKKNAPISSDVKEKYSEILLYFIGESSEISEIFLYLMKKPNEQQQFDGTNQQFLKRLHLDSLWPLSRLQSYLVDL